MILKQTLTVLFIFFSISIIYPNNDTLIQKDTSIVKLLLQLKEVREDTNKVKILKNLSLNLLKSNPKESRRRANQVIELSQKLNYQSGIAAGYNVLALNEEHNGDYIKTIEYYLKSLKILEKINDQINIANVLTNIGTAYKYQGDYEHAKKYLIDGLKIYKNLNDNNGMAINYNALGVLYRELNDFEKAVEYHKKSIEFARRAENKQFIAICSLNLAGDLDYVENFDLVIQSFNQALDVFVEIGDKKGEAITLNNLGAAYMENNKTEIAIDYIQKSIERCILIEFKPLLLHNYFLINKVFLDGKNYKKAYEYLQLYNKLNDELLNETRIKNITELEVKYQIEKKEQELQLQKKNIEILEKDKKLKNYVLYSLLIILILISSIVYAWFKNNKQKKRAEEIEVQHQMEKYMREIDQLQANVNLLVTQRSIPINVDISLESINSFLSTPLSEREFMVLKELSKGKMNKEIAEDLFLSVNTVKTHLLSIYEKLDVKNRTQAVKKVNYLNN